MLFLISHHRAPPPLVCERTAKVGEEIQISTCPQRKTAALGLNKTENYGVLMVNPGVGYALVTQRNDFHGNQNPEDHR